MILWGSIREFPVLAVLQFMAIQRQSGILEVEDFEERGYIYLTEGRIDGISTMGSDEDLGAKLASGGLLSTQQVKECWMNHAEDDSQNPVSAELLALVGDVSDRLVALINRHTVDQVMELMYWPAGTFKMEGGTKPVKFAVVPSLSVENLLLDAYRRVDEGERPKREKVAIENEPCLTCTLECTPEMKERYLKKDVCLWRNMPSVIKEPIFVKRPASSRSPYEEPDEEGLEFL